MKAWAAFLLTRLHYQYAFGGAVWLAWLGILLQNGSIYVPDGWLFGIDYVAFYSAGRMVLNGQGGQLYDGEAARLFQQQLFGLSEGKMMTFMNPPFYALLMVPFASFEFLTSLLAWTVFSLTVYCIGLAGLSGNLKARTLATVLCFFPAFFAIRNGQNSFFTAGLFGMIYGMMRTNRPFSSGLLASLLLYKPHMILGVVFLWLVQIRRWWLALVGLAVGGLLILGVTELTLPGSLAAYGEMSRTQLAEWIYQNNRPLPTQYTIRGLVLSLFPGNRTLAEASQIAMLIACLAGLYAFNRRQPTLSLAYAASIALSVCASPHLLLYDWTILTIPAILLWNEAATEREFWIVPFAVVWFIALVGRGLIELQLAWFPVALHVPYLVLVMATTVVLFHAARISRSTPRSA